MMQKVVVHNNLTTFFKRLTSPALNLMLTVQLVT